MDLENVEVLEVESKKNERLLLESIHINRDNGCLDLFYVGLKQIVLFAIRIVGMLNERIFE